MSDNKEFFDQENEDEKEEGIEIIEYEEEEEEVSRFKEVLKKINKFRNKKPVRIISRLLSSLLLLAIAAGIGVFIAVGQTSGSPVTFAKEYFECFANRNWLNMYKQTEITESKFINLKTFTAAMTEYAINNKIIEYEYTLDDKNSEFAYVSVDYKVEEIQETTTEEGSENSEEPVSEEKKIKSEKHSLTLKKQDEKILWFYSTWKGSVDKYIINNCTIEASPDFTLSFDGQDLSDCLSGVNEETGNNIYLLDRVFLGTHDIVLTADTIDNTTLEVVWEENNSSLVVDSNSIKVKEEDYNSIKEQSTNILVGYYNTALEKKKIDSIKEMVVPNEEVYASMDEQFKALKSEINHADGRTLMSLSIDSYEIVIEEYQYRDKLTAVINYNCSYKAKRPRKVIDGVRKLYEGSNSAVAKVYFNYIDGVWKAVNTDVPCLDYTVENPVE